MVEVTSGGRLKVAPALTQKRALEHLKHLLTRDNIDYRTWAPKGKLWVETYQKAGVERVKFKRAWQHYVSTGEFTKPMGRRPNQPPSGPVCEAPSPNAAVDANQLHGNVEKKKEKEKKVRHEFTLVKGEVDWWDTSSQPQANRSPGPRGRRQNAAPHRITYNTKDVFDFDNDALVKHTRAGIKRSMMCEAVLTQKRAKKLAPADTVLSLPEMRGIFERAEKEQKEKTTQKNKRRKASVQKHQEMTVQSKAWADQVVKKRHEELQAKQIRVHRWKHGPYCYCQCQDTGLDSRIKCHGACPECPGCGFYHRACVLTEEQRQSDNANWQCTYCAGHIQQ